MGSFILVRHATTSASAEGRNLGQRSDLPLSDAGVVHGAPHSSASSIK